MNVLTSDFVCIRLVPFCLLKVNNNKIIKFRMDFNVSQLQEIGRVRGGGVNKARKREEGIPGAQITMNN